MGCHFLLHGVPLGRGKTTRKCGSHSVRIKSDPVSASFCLTPSCLFFLPPTFRIVIGRRGANIPLCHYSFFHNFHLFPLCVMVWIISSHISFHALNFSLALFQWLFNLSIEILISVTVFFIYRNFIFFTSACFFPQGLCSFPMFLILS